MTQYRPRPEGQHNVLQLRCEPIDKVRIGFIGLGVRAKRAIMRMMHIKGVEITAICDLVSRNVDEAQSIIAENGKRHAMAYCDSDGWIRICESADIDLVYVCTDWSSHARIA
ncbi:MAG: hypothetical protein IKA41_04100, partial [Bacteroidaceae bacterium]|nr:hypothetical protein [Bacteroidaceae bacterium]